MMQSGQVVDLDSSRALEAARFKLPLADSLMYATAQRCGAIFWTQNGHFEGLPDVRYFSKVPIK
jgi:toxin FitB